MSDPTRWTNFQGYNQEPLAKPDCASQYRSRLHGHDHQGSPVPGRAVFFHPTTGTWTSIADGSQERFAMYGASNTPTLSGNHDSSRLPLHAQSHGLRR